MASVARCVTWLRVEGSYLGALVGWRGVFMALVPLTAINLAWQWRCLPSIAPQTAVPVRKVFALLRRPAILRAVLASMLTWAGAFSVFTYFRPFLEGTTGANISQLSLLLLAQGAAGFVGTSAAGIVISRRLYQLLRLLPLALAALTGVLVLLGPRLWPVAVTLFFWGAVNAAIPVAWSTWQTIGIADEPESGGGLFVACIQLSIMLGATVGGLFLDQVSIVAAFAAGAALLVAAALVVGDGGRLKPR